LEKEERYAQLIAEAALEENALDLVILNVAELTIIADYFIICNGRSTVQIKSIAETIEMVMEEKEGLLPLRRDGLEQGKWVILDYGSILVHVFRQEERDYYQLDKLWGDAPELTVN
jgi:ribosome-associated protein